MISNFPLWRLRGRRNRTKRFLLLAGFIVFLLDIARITFSTAPGTRISSRTPAGAAFKDQRIFIASTHWNNEDVLRSHWNDAVLDIVKYFGSDNVYVSVLESGSWDSSKDVLRELDEKLGQLGVKRTIELNETTHKDAITRVPDDDEKGWIQTKRGKKELRRIPYLAGLRNRVMDTMLKAEGDSGERFDKVLWLNDVVFTVCSTLSNLWTGTLRLTALSSTIFSLSLLLGMANMQLPAPLTSPNRHSITIPLHFEIR
jgi:hypothetical protein